MSQPDRTPAQHDAERLLARATDDRTLRSRLRAEYRGRHDVLDALWWRVHPLSPAPSGMADPAISLEPLRRAAYARSTVAPVPFTDPASGSTVLISPAELALREATLALNADAADLDAVVRAIHDDPVPAEITPAAPQTALPLRRRAALGIAAVVIVAIAAFALGRLGDRPPSPAAPNPSSSQFAAAQRGTATLALLQSTQTPHDIPPFALGTDTISSTVHLIFDGYGPGVTVYGALGHRDTVCMVVIVAETQSSQTCAPTGRYISDGLRVRVTTGGQIVNDAGYLVPSFYDFTWAGDGTVSAVSNAYLFPAAPGS